MPWTSSLRFRRLGKSASSLLLHTPGEMEATELLKKFRTIRPPNLFLKEFLPPDEAHLLKKLRELKYDKTIYAAYSLHGRVYCRMTRDAPPIRIMDLAQIANIRPKSQ